MEKLHRLEGVEEMIRAQRGVLMANMAETAAASTGQRHTVPATSVAIERRHSGKRVTSLS